MKNNFLNYVLMVTLFGGLIFLVLKVAPQGGVHPEKKAVERVVVVTSPSQPLLTGGSELEVPPEGGFRGAVERSAYEAFVDYLHENVQSTLGIILLQIISILLVARVFSFLLAKIGQPSVIGEILAGIALGPSVLGHFFPEISSFLFAPDSLRNIEILSQIGLVLFMFVIGMELDLNVLKRKMAETFIISHACILLPFLMGVVLAYFVYNEPSFFKGESEVPFLSFALFIGITMSITAFPVLARIIQERDLSRTNFGVLALASAANNDITAWCLLAVVIAVVKAGSLMSALYVIGAAAAFVALMFVVVKPLMKRVSDHYLTQESISKSVVAFVFLLLILSSLCTESLGIHALFGAFLAGVVMPSGSDFRKILIEKIEDVALVFLLPLFFVNSGLHIEIGAIAGGTMWLYCGVFILIAVLGKFLAGTFSTRMVGESWKNSISIGALMNTRGLMELVVLDIGYELKILPAPIFAMLFVMTLVTTFMTGPFLSLIDRIFPDQTHSTEHTNFKMLLSFGHPDTGRKLLQVAGAVFGRLSKELEITAFHATVGTDLNPIMAEEYERESFKPIVEESRRMSLPVKPLYKVSYNVETEIVELIEQEGYDFLLIGSSTMAASEPEPEIPFIGRIPVLGKLVKSVRKPEKLFFPGEMLKDRTRFLLEEIRVRMGIFINRNLDEITSVVLPLLSEEDEFMIGYADKMLRSGLHSVTMIDHAGLFSNPEGDKQYKKMRSSYGRNFLVLSGKSFTAEMLRNHSFMLISLASWRIASEEHVQTLAQMPSALILRQAKPIET